MNLQVEVEDRRGLLAEITSKISDAKTNIRHIDSRVGDNHGCINLIIDVADLDHLKRITQLLPKISGVLRVVRTGMR